MVIGRRKSLFICIFLGLIGNSITMIWNYYLILFGRFLFGISTGLLSAIIPRYIQETIPPHLYEPVGAFFVTCQTCGENFSFLLGEILPDNESPEELMETEAWRVNYFVIPASLFLFTLLAMHFTIKYESIGYLINQELHEEAK